MTISDRVRVKNVEILSDDYYLLQKTNSNIAAATANGRNRPARPMIAATAPPYCRTISRNAP